MDVIKLSDLLKELMGNGSAEELAEQIGLPGQSVRNYIYRPGSKPGMDKLVKIANYAGISLDELAQRVGLEVKVKPASSVPRLITVDDAYRVTKALNAKSKVDLCARLLAEATSSYHAQEGAV